MKELFWGLIFCAVLAVIGIFAFDNLTQSRAELVYQQGQARAAVIEAQGQARLDAAQASAITSAAMFPWLIVFVVSIGATVAVVCLFRFQPARAGQAMPAQIIERQIIFLPGPDHSRRQLLRAVSDIQKGER